MTNRRKAVVRIQGFGVPIVLTPKITEQFPPNGIGQLTIPKWIQNQY